MIRPGTHYGVRRAAARRVLGDGFRRAGRVGEHQEPCDSCLEAGVSAFICVARFGLLVMLGSPETPLVGIRPMGMCRLIATHFLVLPGVIGGGRSRCRGSGRGKRRHGSWSGWRRSPKRWRAGGTPRRGDPRDDGLAGANVLERRAPGGPAAPGGPGAHRRRSTSARLAPVVRPGADDRIRRSAARRVLGHRFRRAGRVDQKETEEMSPGTKAKRKKGSTKKCGVQICLGR